MSNPFAPNPDPPRERPISEKLYSVTRRFDLYTIFVITLAFAGLFAVLRLLPISRGNPYVFLLVAGFITGVGVAQVFLFEGKQPRLASIVAGIILYEIFAFGLTYYEAAQSPAAGEMDAFTAALSKAIGALCFSPFIAVLSYAAGGGCAGVFLVADVLRRYSPLNPAPSEPAKAKSPFDD